MAEPLSVGAGIVGIIVPALHGARLLLDDIEQIRGASKAIIGLKNELGFLKMALQSLQAVKQPDWDSLGGEMADQAKVAITACSDACTSFRDDLQHLTRHSGNGTLSWRDSVNVGFFKKHRIEALSVQLGNCYRTMNLVVSVATLYVSLLHRPS
jgi:hypothetical protein